MENRFIVRGNKITKSKSFSKKHYESFEDTIKYLPYDEWLKLINFVKTKDDKNRKRNVLIFELLISTGMRINEFSLIKVNSINFSEGYIRVPKENTKSGKKRVVRVKKELLLELKDYLMNKNIKSGFVFRNNQNKPFTTRYYNKIIDKYVKHNDLNIDIDFKPHAHTFRHSHIIYSLQNGIPINAIMQNVGHINLSTTQIYSRLAGVDIIKAYDNANF